MFNKRQCGRKQHGAGTDAGSVTIKAKDGGNYSFSETSANFTINKVDHPTIAEDEYINKSATGLSKQYTYNFESVLSGIAGAKIKSVSVGTNEEGVLNVNSDKAQLTPSLTGTTSKEYDGTASTNGISIQLTGIKNSDVITAEATIAYNSANISEADKITATGITLSDNTNYELTATEASIAGTITPKEITLEWSGTDNLTYGDTVNVTATATGLIDGDTCTVTVTGGTEGNAGTHTATATALSNSNYMLPSSSTKTYEVAKAKLTITVAGKMMKTTETLADLSDPVINKDYTVKGLLTDDTLESLSLTYDPATPDTTKKGTVAIKVSEASAGDNYEITCVDGALLIYEKADDLKEKVVEEELTEVAPELQNTEFNTVEKIKNQLSRILTTNTGYTADNVVTHEVKLQFSLNGVTWIDATEENFPTEGTRIKLAYPAGTSKSTHTFMVSHMFTVTSERLGIKAGETEEAAVTAEDDGISVTLNGLSPVSIAYKPITSDTAKKSNTVNTGDQNNIALWWSVVMASIGCGIVFCILRCRKFEESGS